MKKIPKLHRFLREKLSVDNARGVLALKQITPMLSKRNLEVTKKVEFLRLMGVIE